MPTRVPARRPPTRTPAAPPAPAQVLTPRPSTHIRDGLALMAAGIGGYGAATLTGHPQWDLPVLGAGLLGGAAVTVSGHRTMQRNALHDRLVEALAPWLGVRQLDRRIVKLRGWTNGWPGLPRRITVRYAPGTADTDPQWKSSVTSAISSRLLAKYEVVKHDQLRCRLDLRLITTPDAETAGPPYSQVRAERAITELIGPTASVTSVELAGEELRSISVSHQAGAKLAASGYRARIERVISTMMPGRWRAVWDLEGDSVRFEVRPSLPGSVWLPTDKPANTEDLLHNYRQVKIPYAVDEDGREMVWYPARSPMFMITGGTGSGKTSSGHALLGKITQYGWPVWVGDAKRVEFLDFRDWPNVQIVAGSIPQQVALIHAAWVLMEDRYKLIERGQATVNDFEPLVVFLDEFAEFRSNLLEWYAQIKVKGDPTKPPTLAEVASLARKARTARIHLVLSTQRPDAEFLGGEMRDNFGQRMSMGRLSPQGAMMMWENPAVGVSLPRACTGRATATHEDGRPAEVQAYRFPDMHAAEGSDERAILDAIRPETSRHPRLIIVPPEDEADRDLDTGEATPPTFRDYANATWVLATDRPDLDPLAGDRNGDRPDGRALSSTLASLGIGENATRPADRRYTEPTWSAITDDVDGDQGPSWMDPVDEYAGYAPETTTHPRHLLPGDLIRLDPGDDTWVVVDEEPVDDIAEPGLVAISWRGDGDESGALSVSDDADIAVRRPEEFT